MIHGYVEISQESLPLAEAEAVSVAETLGGGRGNVPSLGERLVPVELPGLPSWNRCAGRLALARRCLLPLAPPRDARVAARAEGARGGSAAFRRIGRPSGGGVDRGVLDCGRAFKSAGGTIDLEGPSRRFWLAKDPEGFDHLLEEVGAVDRTSTALRRMPLLPFRRPVSLPPKLARAAVNLARVREGDRVLDPFLGTGALLAEAGLLGGRLYGIDRDAAMVRGALQNLGHLGVGAEELLVGDARGVEFSTPSEAFSAIVTDPPYGRASSTGGTPNAELVAEVVALWRDRLGPDGRLVVIVPEGTSSLEFLGAPRFRVPVRVHGSLTREFRSYERSGVRENPR